MMYVQHGQVSHLLPKDFPTVSSKQSLLVIILAIGGRVYHKIDLYSRARDFAKMSLSYDFGSVDNSVLKTELDGLLSSGIVERESHYQLSPKYVKGLAKHVFTDAPFAADFRRYIEHNVSWRFDQQEIRYCLLTDTDVLDHYYLNVGDEDVKDVVYQFIEEQGDLSAVNWYFLLGIDKEETLNLLAALPHLISRSTLSINIMVEWFLVQDAIIQQFIVYALVSALALLGTPAQIERVTESYLKNAAKKNAEAENVAFIADMLRGDLSQARERGDKFKNYLNILNGNKKKEMPYVIGGFYAALLSFRANVVELKSALTFTRASLKQLKELALQETLAFSFLKLLQEYLVCRQQGSRITFKPNSISTETCKLWANVMLQWEGQHSDLFHINPSIVEGNKRLELEARACGLNYNAESTDEAEQRLKALMAEQGIIPLAALREPEPDWEDLLKVLEAVEAPKPKVKDTVKERLVWRVDFDEFYISPYYQKKQKAGWSKGRNIALRTIYSSTPKYATDIDVQIINCLQRRDGWYGVEYYWNYTKCFPLLVDHPLLFTEEDPMLPVALRKEEVSFIVREKNDELHLSLSDDISNSIVREGERSYKYLLLDDSVRSVTGMMHNKGLDTVIFPKGAKERVVKALNKMSKRVAIRGDFEDPNTLYVDSKNVAVIRLQPKGEELIVSVLIKPTDDELTLLPGVGSATLSHRSASGERMQISRKLKEERLLLQDLKSNVPALQLMDDNELILENEEEVLHFLADMREYAEDVELQWPKGERMSVVKVAAPSDVSFSVTSQLDWFEVSGQVRIDEEHLMSIQDLLEASAGGSKTYIKIDETAFVKLNKDLRKRLSELNTMTEVTEDNLKVHHLGASALNQVMMSAGKTKSDKGWQQNMKRIEALRDFEPELPSNLQAELRPYQLEGYNWLSRLHAWGVGACLADDMGLGKTLQTIALLLKAAPKGPSLVVAPSSVCSNWHSEVARFARVLKTLSLTNTANRDDIIHALEAYDVVVVSYGLLQSNPQLLSRIKWNVVVLDEAHAIKNMQSQRSKAVMSLDAQFKMLTTGTPIQNHIGELWNLFQFINPGFLGSYDQFIKKFVAGADELDTMAKRRSLNAYIAPFILRRNKSDVLDDLPEKTEVTMIIEQSDAEKAMYEALRQRAVAELEESGADDGGGHIKLLAQLAKLRMASCNMRLVEKGSHLPSSKLKALEDLVDDLLQSRHKALVFSQFTKHLALIREMLDAKGITYEYLDGASTTKQRQKAIANFQRGNNDLFLISLKAGGVGLNLTAADYVIHMDPWWNPAVEDQASDRAHRIGQSRPVTVYRLVAEGTIEEKIVKLHHAKRTLADDLLSGTDKSAKISSAELFELMR